MAELTGTIRSQFIQDLDFGNATEVKAAAFTQGIEDEIVTRFYRLNGCVVRSVENRRTTSTRFFFVDGTDRQLFDAHYPDGGALR